MDISESIEHTISTYFSQWLGHHPYLAWSIAHPLPSLGLLLLAIFSLSGLLRAIGRGIEQIWLFLLKTPFKLLQPIFRLIWSLIARILGNTNSSAVPPMPKPSTSLRSAQVDQIVSRLQTLSQEQESLLCELATLISSDSVQSQSSTISDTQYDLL